MNAKRIELIWVIVVISVFLALPFFLNWILQKEAFIPVVGDSSIWLSFWGTYIGAILTAIMVYVAFLTIRKTGNLNKTQWKIEWLNSFRNAAADLVSAIDPTSVGQMAQDVKFWRFEYAVDKGHEMEMAVKKSSFLLSSILKEYDAIFDEKQASNYIDELNSIISPFILVTEEIIQFAILCKYLKEKTDVGNRSEGVDAILNMVDDMEKKGYHIIYKAIQSLAIDKEKTEIVIHDTVVLLQQNLAGLNTEGVKKILLRIDSLNAKRIYSDYSCR